MTARSERPPVMKKCLPVLLALGLLLLFMAHYLSPPGSPAFLHSDAFRGLLVGASLAISILQVTRGRRGCRCRPYRFSLPWTPGNGRAE
jgi:hypothetical protein